MPAATASDLTTTDRSLTDRSASDRGAAGPPRLGLAGAGDADARGASTSSVSVTLRIDVRGENLPPAVAGLLEAVAALAGPAGVSVTHAADPAPGGRIAPGEFAGSPEQVGLREPGALGEPSGVPEPAVSGVRAEPVDPAGRATVAGGQGAAVAGRPTVPGGWVADDPAVAGAPGAGAPADGWAAWPRPRLVRGVEPPAAVPALRIYRDSRLVLRAGMPIRLTRREYDLLTFLCEHPRRVFSRGQLMRQVWGHEMVGGERTVDVHVRRLRVKLGEPGPVISTVRGVGYRLDDVTSVAIVGDSR